MVTAAELGAIDQAHRQQQAQNAAQAARAVLAYWLLVDAADVSGSGGAWLDRSMAAILRGRERSALLASAYAISTRRAQIPGVPDLQIPPVPPANLEQIRQSLVFTGLGNAVQKIQMTRRTAPLLEQSEAAGRQVALSIAAIERRSREQRGAPSGPERESLQRERSIDRSIQRVMMEAGAAAAAAATRHVQNAGRDLIDEVVRSDRRAVGYVRITREDPCSFCAMLASRGPVYRADSFAASDPRYTGPGEHKVHDTCGCTIRPVYTNDPFQWPQQSQDFEQLWRETMAQRAKWRDIVITDTRTKTSRKMDDRTAFRWAYEGRASW